MFGISNPADFAQAKNIKTSRVSVGTSPTLLLDANEDRLGAIIVKHSKKSLYLGGPAVSTTTGLLVTGAAGTAFSLEVGNTELYGVVESGTQILSIMEALS